MADETFDAVIVGGGTKALFLAMYLVKYAGMSVGIFERTPTCKASYRLRLSYSPLPAMQPWDLSQGKTSPLAWNSPWSLTFCT